MAMTIWDQGQGGLNDRQLRQKHSQDISSFEISPPSFIKLEMVRTTALRNTQCVLAKPRHRVFNVEYYDELACTIKSKL
eukprot:scaffold2524_cov86-Skeletonema_dohrnii-CCMP3373.AAC.3